MMFQMNIPKVFWGEIVLITSYLINRMSTYVLKYETPTNTLKQCYTTSHHLFSSLTPKVFGCTAFVHIHGHNHSKFDPKAQKCIFLGYYPTQKGYKFYHPQLRKYFTSMEVSFFENQPYNTQNSLQEENREEENFQEVSQEEIGGILENILVEEKKEEREP